MTAEAAFRARFQTEGVAPNADAIAKIWWEGFIACLVFEIDPDCTDAPKALGWDGVQPVFKVTPEAAKLMADTLQEATPDDAAAIRWLRAPDSERPYRLLVFVHKGSLMLNHVQGKGFAFEPGTQDREWKS